MQPKPAIRVEGLTKVFHLHRSAWQRIRAALSTQTIEGDHRLLALNQVSFSVNEGESLGIVGPNGAGKSTLLKILAGILAPSSGSVEVNGKVASIIELGGGFHPEFTGRQNFFMNGSILGFSQGRLAEIFDDVLEFSGLGEFIDMPIKTYSSGMWARLAFAIAIHMEPRVLLVDEALAVGDAVFAHRCLGRIHRMREAGVSIVLVTHDVNAVKQMCDQAILLDQGSVAAQGETESVLMRYQTMVAERLSAGEATGQFQHVGAKNIGPGGMSIRYGTFEAVIEGFTIRDAEGQPTLRIKSGTKMSVEVAVAFHRDVDDPIFGIMLRNRFGIEVFGTNTQYLGRHEGPFKAGQRITVKWDLDLFLRDGTYTVSLAVHALSGEYYDYQVEAATIEVMGPVLTVGVANLPMDFTIAEDGSGAAPRHLTPAPERGGQPE